MFMVSTLDVLSDVFKDINITYGNLSIELRMQLNKAPMKYTRAKTVTMAWDGRDVIETTQLRGKFYRTFKCSYL